MSAIAVKTDQATQFKTDSPAISPLQLSGFSQNVLIDNKNVLIKNTQAQAPAGAVLGSNSQPNAAPIIYQFSVETIPNVLADGQPVLVVNDQTPIVTGTFINASPPPPTVPLPTMLIIADAGQANVEAS